MLDLGNTRDKGVLGTHARLERLVLGRNANLFGRQTRFTELHVDKLHTCSAFDILDYAHELANRRCAKFLGVAQTKINTGLVHELFVQRKAHGNFEL